MAKGYAGYSSGVPTTTGIGQGDAQVFTPISVKNLDTSALQRGIGSLERTSQRNKAANNAELQRQKRQDAALAKEVQGLADGNFTVYQQGFEKMDQDFFDGLDEAEDLDQYTADFLTKRNSVTQSEQRYKDLMKHAYKTPNEKVFDEESGRWVSSFDYYGRRLNRDLDETDIELIDEGSFGQYMDNDYLDGHSKTVAYDPDFSADREVVDQFAKWASQSNDTQAYLNAYKNGVDIKTIISQMPEEQEDRFREYIKNQSDLQSKWAVKSMVDQNLPDYIVNDPSFSEDLNEQWGTYVDQVALPSTKKTKKDFRSDPAYQKPKQTGSGGLGVDYEVSYTNDSNFDYTGEEIKQQPSVFLGDTKVKGQNVVGLTKKDGKEAAIVTYKDDNDEIITDVKTDDGLVTGYKNNRLNQASEAEKSSVDSVLTEFSEAKPKSFGLSKERKEEIKTLIKDIDDESWWARASTKDIQDKLNESGIEVNTAVAKEIKKEVNKMGGEDYDKLVEKIIKVSPESFSGVNEVKVEVKDPLGLGI